MTTFPALTLDDVFDTSPRIDDAALWVLPARDVEFDAERILATYQRTTRDTLATMRLERPHMRSVHELCALADALFARWYGKA